MWNWFCHYMQRESTPRRRNRVLDLEQLEPRVVLTANVTAVVLGGSLIVTGGDPVTDGSNSGAEVFVRQNGPGSFVVQNTNGTLNGTYDIGEFLGVTRDLRFSFGSGDDSLTFDQTNPITVKESVTINSGLGHNQVYSTYDHASPGSPAVPGSLKIGGHFSIMSAGGHFVELSNLNVRGDMNVRSLANGADATGAGLLSEVSIGVSEPTRRSQIGGNLLIANGRSLNNDQTFLNSLDVKGSVTIRNHARNATVDIGSSTGKSTILGNLQITNGPGELYQTNLTSVDVKRNVQIDNQGSNTTTNIGSVDGQTSIAGDVCIVNLPGKSSTTEMQVADTTVQRTNVGRNLQVSATNVSNQSISLLSSTVAGSTYLHTGKGDDVFFIEDAVFGKYFVLQAGAGADVVSIGTGGEARILVLKVVYETRDRQIPVTVIDPVTGETHTEYVVQTYTVAIPVPESVQVTRVAGAARFNGKVRAKLGRGDDVLNLAKDAIVTFKKSATLNGQPDSNTANVGTGKVVGKARLKNFIGAK